MSEEFFITDLSKRGRGIAGNTHVVGALPGEKVLARVCFKDKKNKLAQIEQILTPAKERVALRCGHAPKCGGCTLQALDYPYQLQFKEKSVHALFSPEKFHPIVACTDPWRYRNKMEYSFSQTSKGFRYLGLMYAGGKSDVFNIEECHLTDAWYIKVRNAVFAWWEKSGNAVFHLYKNTGALRSLTVRGWEDRAVMLTYSNELLDVEGFVAAVTAASDKPIGVFIQNQVAIKGSPTKFILKHLAGPEKMHESIGPLKVELGPTSFFQPNSRQAYILYKTAFALLNLKGTERVFDLYSGAGTIALSIAPMVKEVIGVEINEEAACDAEKNRQLNGIENARFIAGDVEKILANLGNADLVIVDPPRAGMGPKSVETLLHIKAAHILYISCNPETQSEDAKMLIAGGYRLTDIQPIDQFPHTMHIENIALFKLTDS